MNHSHSFILRSIGLVLVLGAVLLTLHGCGGGGGGENGGDTQPTLPDTIDAVNRVSVTVHSDVPTVVSVDDVALGAAAAGSSTWAYRFSDQQLVEINQGQIDLSRFVTLRTELDRSSSVQLRLRVGVNPADATDGVPPQVTLTASASSVEIAGSVTCYVTASEGLSGFPGNRLQISGGTFGAWNQVDSTHFEASVTAQAIPGTLAISLPPFICYDLSGNLQSEPASLSLPVNDTVAPQLTLTASASTVTESDSLGFLLTASEPVTGLDQSELQVTGGTIASWNQLDATRYALVVSATTGSGILTVRLPNHSCVDLSGNPQVVDATLSVPIRAISQSITHTGTESMRTPRRYHTSTLLSNGKVLGCGGYAGTTTLTSAELYDPESGTWSVTGPLVAGRYVHTATILRSGKVLVTGGMDNGRFVASCELYDPARGTWSTTRSLSSGRYLHTATLLQSGKVLVTGGSNSNESPNNGTLTTCELFDPDTGMWTITGSLNNARNGHTAILLSTGKVLVTGGSDGTVVGGHFLSSSEIYDPATGAWSATGNLETERYMHTATLLNDGQVLVTGGYNVAEFFPTLCEIFNPTTGIWSRAGHLSVARDYHTATLLPSGEVLVTGGYQFFGGVRNVAESELYIPGENRWVTSASLNTGRRYPCATMLPSGQVLISGGYATAELSSCELFNPDRGSMSGGQPAITSAPAMLSVGSSLSLTGTLFTGRSEGSSGGNNTSPTNYPLVQVQSTVNGQTEWLPYDPTGAYSATSVVAGPINELPPGLAWVRVFVNGIPSNARPLTITP